MLYALEQIRRMRGGTQSHLMRCSDGHFYVVKFQNNPQHSRVLVNDLLGTRMAALMGLPTAPVAVVDVSAELIRRTPELCVEMTRRSVPCQSGPQFGSRFPGDPLRMTLHDFLPDEKLVTVNNLGDFAGMFVFDKWTCNTDGRQTIFFRREHRHKRKAAEAPTGKAKGGPRAGVSLTREEPNDYETVMIDQGFCFNAGDWSFPDAPLHGLYGRNRVYQSVTSMEAFAPWLQRLDEALDASMLEALSCDIPPEWYAHDFGALARLLQQLERRRLRVPELIWASKKSCRQPFANWV